MSESPPFAEFIDRIRAGDAEAAAELVRRYEPIVRLEVRVRLRDPRLRRAFDSLDICQSVMASFFIRAAGGQYDLEEPRDLVKLLVAMARNKVAFQARMERAGRRDSRRLESILPDELEAAGTSADPGDIASFREMIALIRERLNDEERQLADRRARGDGWNEIASALGGSAAARRKQLERAIDRISRQLGLEDDADEQSH
jgi:hypothetical protein